MKKPIAFLLAICLMIACCAMIWNGLAEEPQAQTEESGIIRAFFLIANNRSARGRNANPVTIQTTNQMAEVFAARHFAQDKQAVLGYVLPCYWTEKKSPDITATPFDLKSTTGVAALARAVSAVTLPANLSNKIMEGNMKYLYQEIVMAARRFPEDRVKVYLLTDQDVWMQEMTEVLDGNTASSESVDGMLAEPNVQMEAFFAPSTNPSAVTTASHIANQYPNFSYSSIIPEGQLSVWVNQTGSADGVEQEMEEVELLWLMATYSDGAPPAATVDFIRPGGGAEASPEAIVFSNRNYSFAVIPSAKAGTYQLHLTFDENNQSKTADYFYAITYPAVEQGAFEVNTQEVSRGETVSASAYWKPGKEWMQAEDFEATLLVERVDRMSVASENAEDTNTEGVNAGTGVFPMEYDTMLKKWDVNFALDEPGNYRLVPQWTHESVDWRSVVAWENAATLAVGNRPPAMKEGVATVFDVLAVGSDEPWLLQSISLEELFEDPGEDKIELQVYLQKPEVKKEAGSVHRMDTGESDDVFSIKTMDAETLAPSPERSLVEPDSLEYANKKLKVHWQEDGEYSLWVLAADSYGSVSEPIEIIIRYEKMMPKLVLEGEAEQYMINGIYKYTLETPTALKQALTEAGFWEEWKLGLQASMEQRRAGEPVETESITLGADERLTFLPIQLDEQVKEYELSFKAFWGEGTKNNAVRIVNAEGEERTVVSFSSVNTPPKYSRSLPNDFEASLGGFLTKEPSKTQIEIDLSGVFTDDTDQVLTLHLAAQTGRFRAFYEEQIKGESVAVNLDADDSQDNESASTAWLYHVNGQSGILHLMFESAEKYSFTLTVTDSAENELENPIEMVVTVKSAYRQSLILCAYVAGGIVLLLIALLMLRQILKPRFFRSMLHIGTEGQNVVSLDHLKKRGITLVMLLAWAQYPPLSHGSGIDPQTVLFMPSRSKKAMVRLVYRGNGIQIVPDRANPNQGRIQIHKEHTLFYSFVEK